MGRYPSLINTDTRGLQANRCQATDVEEADGVAFELLALGLVPFDIW